jgi:hypothetical protein
MEYIIDEMERPFMQMRSARVMKNELKIEQAFTDILCEPVRRKKCPGSGNRYGWVPETKA